MSYQSVAWALDDCPMLMTEKGKPDTTCRFVLVVLAEHADEHGHNTRPSVLRIAHRTGFDETTVERALRRLKAGKLIKAVGKDRHGVTRWSLAMDRKRDPREWDWLVEAAERKKAAESASRQQRRNRQAARVAEALAAAGVDLSGTQNPGQATADEPPADGTGGDVRHAESRTPEHCVPDAGTQNPGVRHATPPEPPVTPPVNHPGNHHGGHAAPRTPLRPVDPAGRPTDHRAPADDHHGAPPQPEHGDSRPREAAHAAPGPVLVVVEGNPAAAPGRQRGLWPSAVDVPDGAAAPPGDPDTRPGVYGPPAPRQRAAEVDADDGDQAVRRPA